MLGSLSCVWKLMHCTDTRYPLCSVPRAVLVPLKETDGPHTGSTGMCDKRIALSLILVYLPATLQRARGAAGTAAERRAYDTGVPYGDGVW